MSNLPATNTPRNSAEVEERIKALGSFGNQIAEAAKVLRSEPLSFWHAVECALQDLGDSLRDDYDDDEEDEDEDDYVLIAPLGNALVELWDALERLEAPRRH